MGIIATVAVFIVLAMVGAACDTGGGGKDGRDGEEYRDKQGRLQLQDDPALDGLKPGDCAKYPELQACQ